MSPTAVLDPALATPPAADDDSLYEIIDGNRVALPPMSAYAVRGAVTREPIPADLRAHRFGPRLAATLSYLSGCRHVRRRGVEEVVETVFDLPVSLGTIHALEQETSPALAAAHPGPTGRRRSVVTRRGSWWRRSSRGNASCRGRSAGRSDGPPAPSIFP